jgi:hypothetical protein
VCGRVSDARTSRGNPGYIALAIIEIRGNRRRGGGSARKKLEAEPFTIETWVNEIPVAVVVLTVGIFVGRCQAKGHSANEDEALHCQRTSPEGWLKHPGL